jgi:aspartate beta-hydroxylase
LPHTDTEVGHEDYVIAHVPLIIPQGDVGFIEGDETGHWVEGNSFILDVETPHSIWNRSSEFRVVMLLELVKETAYV